MGPRAAHPPTGGAVELLTNPVLAHLHPTGDHPERPDRLLVLEGEIVEREATHEQLARVHEHGYLELLQAVDRPVQLDADTVCSKTSWRGGDARGRDHARGRRPRRFRTRPAARAPRARRAGDGLLPRQQRGGRGAVRPGGARARASRHRRLRRPSRQRHRGPVPRRRHRLLRLAPPVAVLAGIRRPGHERRVDAEHPAAGAFGRRRLPERVRDVGRAGGARRSAPTSSSSRPASTRTGPTRWRRWRCRKTDSGSSPSVAPHSARASPPCSKAATTSRRCRHSWPQPTAASAAPENANGRLPPTVLCLSPPQRSLEGKRALPASARRRGR